MVHCKPYIDIGDLLMLVVCLEDEEYGCCSTELEGALYHRGHKHTLCNEFLQVVQGNALHVEVMLDGAEANVPQVETILLWRVSLGMEPLLASFRSIWLKLSAAI